MKKKVPNTRFRRDVTRKHPVKGTPEKVTEKVTEKDLDKEADEIRAWLDEREIKYHANLGIVKLRKLKAENEE